MPNKCPRCKSEDLEGYEDSFMDEDVFLWVKCEMCGFRFCERYHFVEWKEVITKDPIVEKEEEWKASHR